MSKTLSSFWSVLLLCGCSQVSTHPAAEGPGPGPAANALDVNHDYHSYANTADFRTRHLALDLKVDFGQRVLSGTV